MLGVRYVFTDCDAMTSPFISPPALSFSWQPVINYIDSKFEDFLNAESRVNRRQMPDNRVHCCLYFIAPSGHGWVLHPAQTKPGMNQPA